MRGILSSFVVLLFTFFNPLYSQNCIKERIYTQTDRNAYLAGETVWFKSYIYSQFAPDEEASVLFVELIDQQNKPVIKGVFPVSGGAAFGNIEISPILADGVYMLRSYIKKSIADSSSSFTKYIYVANPQKKNSEWINAEGLTKSQNYFTVFANAGNLVAGVKNEVFFTAKNAFMLPVDVSGEVTDAKHETVASFKTAWNGTARIAFIPQKGEQYTANVHFKEGTKTYSIGEVVTDKVAVELSKNANTVVFQVSLPPEMQTGQKAMVYGIIDRNIVFQKEFSLSKETFSAAIPTNELPASVMDIVVVGPDRKKILGYRSVFLNNKTAFAPLQFKTDSVNLQPGGINVFTLQVPDSMMANVSVSVTDIQQDAGVESATIFSDLLLQRQETKHPFVLPGSFTIEQDDKLNLLLATAITDPQKMMPEDSKSCALIDSNYISFSGTVFNKKTGKPVGSSELKIIFSTLDSGFSVLMVPLDNAGRFSMNKMIYEGMGRYKYELNSKKNEEVIVKLDSVNLSTVPHFRAEDALPLYALLTGNELLKKNNDIRFAEINDTVQHGTLAGVTVYTRKLKPVDKVNEKYARGLFQGNPTANMLDFINDPPPATGINILDYLTGQINGLLISGVVGNYKLESTRRTSFGQSPPVYIYLNEQPADANALMGIRVSDVAMVKYFAPGTHQISFGQFVGILAVYTRKWDDYAEADRPGFKSFSVKGFTPAKDFNATIPDKQIAAVENRATLYWNPMVLLDKEQRSFTFRFPSSAKSKRMYVKVQGFTPDGKLISFEKLIE